MSEFSFQKLQEMIEILKASMPTLKEQVEANQAKLELEPKYLECLDFIRGYHE